MGTSEIIKEINRLPISERIYVVEKTIHSIRTSKDKNQMKNAVNELYAEYKSNKELTIFTNLDLEAFYEAK